MAHKNPPADDCGCDHHGHHHDQDAFPLSVRWGIAVLTIAILLFALRPFIIGQMFVRVTSYSSNAAYGDAVRICKKILAIDGDNVQAMTALGYAYMDLSQIEL